MTSIDACHPASELLAMSPTTQKGGTSSTIELPILYSNLKCLGKELRKGYSVDQTQDLCLMCSKLPGKTKLNLPMIHG